MRYRLLRSWIPWTTRIGGYGCWTSRTTALAARADGAVYLDCVKAIDLALEQSWIDPERVVIAGRSQGGGIASAVSDYLREHPDQIDRVFETLSYFDTMNMADRITATTIASVALDDIVCPPECYFATYKGSPGRRR